MNKSSFLAFDLYSIHEHNKKDSLHHEIIIHMYTYLHTCVSFHLFIHLYLSFFLDALPIAI